MQKCGVRILTRIDALVLELGDLDVILGATWMRRFGKVTFDWKSMSLSFPWQGKMVELQGIKALSESSNSSLHSLLEAGEIEFDMTPRGELKAQEQQDLNHMLADYKEFLKNQKDYHQRGTMFIP